jgi:hypothetical protein
MKYLLILSIILSVNLHADLAIKYGLGVAQSAKDSNSETKVISIAYQEQIAFLEYLIKQYEVGAYIDSRQDLGRRSSGFATASLGVHVNAAGTYCQALWGVGGITNVDSYLGGNFQFNQDLSVGFRDNNGAMIGVNYKHISSAGLYMPNVGRDFLMIKMSVPW